MKPLTSDVGEGCTQMSGVEEKEPVYVGAFGDSASLGGGVAHWAGTWGAEWGKELPLLI